jgi:hypothetical protein
MTADAYTPTPADKFSFGIWTLGWQGVDVFGPAIRPPMRADRAVAFRADPDVKAALAAAHVGELAEPTLAPGETWRDVAGFTPDIEALAARGMAFEHLDQLALEHLYGVR